MLEASLRDVLSDKQLTQQDLDKTEATLEQLQAFADDVVSYRSLGTVISLVSYIAILIALLTKLSHLRIEILQVERT